MANLSEFVFFVVTIFKILAYDGAIYSKWPEKLAMKRTNFAQIVLCVSAQFRNMPHNSM